MRKFFSYFILIHILIIVGCSPQKKEVKTYSYLNTILYPIGNSTVRGFVKFQQKDQNMLIDVFIVGVLPLRSYHLYIHEFGDISAIDGQSNGEILTIINKDQKIKIGDLGVFKSDHQGAIVTKKNIPFTPSSFMSLVGRSFSINFSNSKINNLKLGHGVIGIGNKISLK